MYYKLIKPLVHTSQFLAVPASTSVVKIHVTFMTSLSGGIDLLYVESII
jgi:hypothetical protein